MACFLMKYVAQGFDNGFGVFLACEPRDGYFDAMAEAMRLEYDGRADRVDGKMIQYDVWLAPIANQAEFDAKRRADMLAPVVNVYD